MKLASNLFLIMALMLAAVLLLVRKAQGSDCVRQRIVHGKVYHAPVTYSHQSYGYNYVAPTYQQPYYYPPSYFSIQDYYRDSLLADAVAYRILTNRGKVGETQPADGVRPRPVPDPAGPLPALPPAGQSGIQTKVSEALAKVIANRCVKCHGGQPGRADLRNPATTPAFLRSESFRLVNRGEMPQKEKELSNEEVLLFDEWAADGARAERAAARK